MTKLPTASSDTTNWEVAKNYRNTIIEECARVAESCAVVTDYGREKIAAAIRALKDKP